MRLLRLTCLITLPCLLLAACNRQHTDGEVFSLADYQGRWVILNYWAEWCGPCLEEIPALNALNRQHADKLVVLAVNFDRISGDELKQLAREMNIQFELVDPDPADILKLSQPASLPTTYLFNPEGILSAKLVGPQTEASLLERIGYLEHTDL